MKNEWDLVVVGAGPAGSTLAALVKIHEPAARVLILEREAFPRHHIGESLLPGMVPVLRELGVYDRIDSAGFLRKVGVTFVWGKSRKPWHADFTHAAMLEARRTGRPPAIPWTWQVPRAEYDRILLENAREKGVAVWRASALGPLRRDDRIRGLFVQKGARRMEVRSRLVADCSGQAGFLPELRRSRKYRPELKNMAMYAYFRGAKWKYRYVGHADKTRIFVCSVPQGWFWYIPLSTDLVSIGLVSKLERFKRDGKGDPEGYFRRALADCREIRPLLKDASVQSGMDPAEPGKTFFTAGDWSFETGSAAGPGWLAAGDSAYFIDPLLSSGVPLAHLSAQRAAYTVVESMRRTDPAVLETLWSQYGSYCREIGSSFLELVRFWYAQEPEARRWWRTAADSIRASTPLRIDPKSAFTAVAAGVNRLFETAYIDRTFLTAGNARGESSRVWKHGADHAHRGPNLSLIPGARSSGSASGLRASGLAMLSGSVEWSRHVLPIEPSGKLGVVWKATFAPPGSKGAARFQRTLTGLHRRAVHLLRSPLDVGALRSRLAGEYALPVEIIDSQLRALIEDLASAGVVRLSRARQASAAGIPRSASAVSEFRKGESLLEQGRAMEADSHLTRSIEAGLAEPWPLALRAAARGRLGRFDEAMADFKLALTPRTAGREVGLDEWAAEFEDAIHRGWILEKVLLMRARVREAAGDRAGALSDAEAILRINPTDGVGLRLRSELTGRGRELAASAL